MVKIMKSRPEWDEFFMMHAYLAATRSSCLYLNTGAAIVKDKRVRSMGYNGAPSGIGNCLELGCRKENFDIEFESKGSGTCRGRHAEENAMSLLPRSEMKDSDIYTLYYPCGSCAKSIVGNDISRVFYSEIYKDNDALTDELFKEKGIEVIKLELDLDKIWEFISNLK